MEEEDADAEEEDEEENAPPLDQRTSTTNVANDLEVGDRSKFSSPDELNMKFTNASISKLVAVWSRRRRTKKCEPF